VSGCRIDRVLRARTKEGKCAGAEPCSNMR
jgi:hypothetical protein